MRIIHSFLAAGLLLAACADSIGTQENPSIDSFRSPTYHGEIGIHGDREVAELTEERGYHAWTFSVTDDAEVRIGTSKALGSQAPVDTKLYLYRRQDDKWGRNIDNNDNAHSDTLLSAIESQLQPGEYRILVKGHDEAIRGKFGVQIDCLDGPGCVSQEMCEIYDGSMDACMGLEGLPMQICIEDYDMPRGVLAGCCEIEDSYFLYCPLPAEVERSKLDACLDHASAVIDCELDGKDALQCAADSLSFDIADLQACCSYDSYFLFCDSIDG